MKKVLSLIAVAGMFAFIACGPSAEEKEAMDKARKDSIEQVEKARQDSIAMSADMEKARQDSMAKAQENAADTAHKAEEKH
jgi:hypothetical protein